MKKAQYVMDSELFKKLNDAIWEFRTQYNGNAYRMFAFWDKSNAQDTLVVATHGMIKKNQKTPINEILNAERIRKNYFENKLA